MERRNSHIVLTSPETRYINYLIQGIVPDFSYKADFNWSCSIVRPNYLYLNTQDFAYEAATKTLFCRTRSRPLKRLLEWLIKLFRLYACTAASRLVWRRRRSVVSRVSGLKVICAFIFYFNSLYIAYFKISIRTIPIKSEQKSLKKNYLECRL